MNPSLCNLPGCARCTAMARSSQGMHTTCAQSSRQVFASARRPQTASLASPTTPGDTRARSARTCTSSIASRCQRRSSLYWRANAGADQFERAPSSGCAACPPDVKHTTEAIKLRYAWASDVALQGTSAPADSLFECARPGTTSCGASCLRVARRMPRGLCLPVLGSLAPCAQGAPVHSSCCCMAALPLAALQPGRLQPMVGRCDSIIWTSAASNTTRTRAVFAPATHMHVAPGGAVCACSVCAHSLCDVAITCAVPLPAAILTC